MTTISDMLRPLAEATVPCPGGEVLDVNPAYCTRCETSLVPPGDHGTIPDPRFVALRGEHEWWPDPPPTKRICTRCSTLDDEHAGPYCLRIDLGSIAAVLAEFDFEIRLARSDISREWYALLYRPAETGDEVCEKKRGDTPAEAAGRALVAAVFEAVGS